MKEDSKSAIGFFCCGIILGVLITLAVSKIPQRSTCDHSKSDYDITFSRTSADVLIIDVNTPKGSNHIVYQPEDRDYPLVIFMFDAYLSRGIELSHGRGKQVTFCSYCLPFQEDWK